uniref:NADH-ubiquinone oxidoreductase chain 2 n=1 Tax=Figites sp. ZJUH 20220009 TaxID=2995276 RepID=A0A9E8GDQ4_9HYME|nr:NADH dehydrogenase subunit 2 [Figites sp. ZJUH 20220009]
MNFNLLILLSLLILSITLGLSSNSYFYFWMSIEINMMAFIPMMLFYNKYYNNSLLKYYIIQSIGSSLILFFSILTIPLNSMNFFMFIILAISLKIGGAPFMKWYLNLLKNLSWFNCFFLMTIQKILPFFILNSIIKNNYYINNMLMTKFMFMLIILTSILTLTFLKFSNNLKIFMGISSINHLSWLMLIMMINQNFWLIYFLLYTMMLMNLIYMMMKMKLYYLHNLYIIMNKNNFMKTLFSLNLLIFMGIPPFMSFFLKTFSSMLFINSNLYFINYLLMIIFLFIFFYYLKILTPSMLFFNINNINNMKMNINYNIYFLMSSKLMMLISLIYWLMNY